MDLKDFFEKFNIEPNDERLYLYALTHRSYVHQKRKNKREDQQERLEFFGDAVLKFVVSYFLMHKFPNMEEGMLTKIRARIISDRSLAQLGRDLKLEYTQEWFSDIIETHMAVFLDVDFIVDYKTFLQEVVQKHGSQLPKYDCYKMTGPEHKKIFHYKVSVTFNGASFSSYGEGENKKLAQQVAAKACVEVLREKKLIK